MLNTLTAIFVTIATIYILVVGVNLPMPSEHKKFLKNDYFLATLMFFLCYFYTGNIGITIFGLIFYFYFKYHVKSENNNNLAQGKFFRVKMFDNLFKTYDTMTDEEYEKIKIELEDKSNYNENVIDDEQDQDDGQEYEQQDQDDDQEYEQQDQDDDQEYERQEHELQHQEHEQQDLHEEHKHLDDHHQDYDKHDDKIENNIPSNKEEIEDNYLNIRTLSDDKNDKLFNFNEFKNEVGDDILLGNNLSEDYEITPKNNFSKEMDKFEYIDEESEHFSDIENIKNNINTNVNTDDTITPFDKQSNLVALTK